jgi:hypothetical protein
MQLLSVAPDLLTFVVSLADEVPDEEDVKAGWLAFAIFIGLILAVAFLGFSLVKHLRRAQASEEAGRYDPSGRSTTARPSDPSGPSDPADEPGDQA